MVNNEFALRFWGKVKKRSSGCWEWQAGRDGSGYGLFWHPERKKNVGAHRVAYELANGVPPGNMFVLHSCDNPLCVNPDHLSLGTLQDNVDDMVAKNRQAKGSRNKQFCINGHKMTKENTYTYIRHGMRNTACKTCRSNAYKKFICNK